jgi:DNA-directed RNA polymerase subunit RPC12/RpoP
MAELGRIHAQKKLACAHCQTVLPDWTSEELLDEPRCPSCGKRVKLPDEVLEKARRSRYLGTNLDFTC